MPHQIKPTQVVRHSQAKVWYLKMFIETAFLQFPWIKCLLHLKRMLLESMADKCYMFGHLSNENTTASFTYFGSQEKKLQCSLRRKLNLIFQEQGSPFALCIHAYVISSKVEMASKCHKRSCWVRVSYYHAWKQKKSTAHILESTKLRHSSGS